MRLLSILVITTFAVASAAQSARQAQVFSGAEIHSQTASLAAAARKSGSSGIGLGSYSSHAIQISVRTKSGEAEVHAHFDDIFLVTEGKATLITGGTVLNPKSEGNGETKGSGIRNGTSRMISKGDVVNIPAGTPHQLILIPGITYASIVIKVHEP